MVKEPTDLQDPNGFATSCFTDEVDYSQSDDYAWSVFYPERALLRHKQHCKNWRKASQAERGPESPVVGGQAKASKAPS